MAVISQVIPGIVWDGPADGASQVVDGGANLFVAFRQFSSDPQHGQVDVYKITPAGEVSLAGTVVAAGTHKVDASNIAQSGADLHVALVSHTTADPRTFQPEIAVIPGVCVPYPGNHPQLAAAGAFAPDPNPVPGAPVDVSQASMDAIASETQDKVRRAVQLSNSNTGQDTQTLASSMLHWAKQAVDDKHVLTTDNLAAAMYQPTMDRVYQTFESNVPGFWAWLRNKVNGG